MFPSIKCIEDILPHIEGRDEFVVVNKGDYTVINYVVLGNDTFPSNHPSLPFLRECRGLIFDSITGKLINRRYHKFFNINERQDCSIDAIDFSQPHFIMNKIDGSMVSACGFDMCTEKERIVLMTKMGATDVAQQAQTFFDNNPGYYEFCREWIKANYTPIFEWCSSKNRIVLDYGEDQLILVAIRGNTCGNYISYDTLVQDSEYYDIPLVGVYYFEDITMQSIVNKIRTMEDVEGIVVKFDSGEMYKIKCDWYLQIHKVKSMLDSEKDVVSLILEKQLDDLLPVLPEQDRKKVLNYSSDLIDSILLSADLIYVLINKMIIAHSSKKDFALSKNFTDKKNNISKFSSIIFKYWDETFTRQDINNYIIENIIKKCANNKNFNEVKSLFFDNVRYNESKKD
jgi:RNA ligase